MRRLALILLVATAVVPAAALAARSAAGDGVLELKSVNGLVILTGHGVIWGQMDKGWMKVTDPDPTDGQQPFVSGADHTRPAGENATTYWGTNIHFRFTSGGRYRIRFFKASGINVTAIGVGTADITGDPLATDTGSYALNGGKWQPVPLSEKVIAFPPPAAPPSNP